MGFDIRLPIGMMFAVLGVLVGAYGAATRGSVIYARHSLGINVNLWWGALMLLFGAVMLLLSRRGAALKGTDRGTKDHTGQKLGKRGEKVAG